MLTAPCRLAIESLRAALNGTAEAGALDEAIQHVQGCPLCRRRLGHLAAALARAEEDQFNCGACQELLPEYLLARDAGQAGAARWRPVAVHLRICPHCAAAEDELAALVALPDADEEADVARPAASPEQPRGPQAAGSPWTLDSLGRLVIALSAELLRAFQPPAYAQAMAKSGAAPQVVYQLEVSAPDLVVTLTAEQGEGEPERCTLIAQVQRPSKGGWPHLGGTEVTLSREGRVLATGETSAFGRAVFAGIATADLPRLVVTITPAP